MYAEFKSDIYSFTNRLEINLIRLRYWQKYKNIFNRIERILDGIWCRESNKKKEEEKRSAGSLLRMLPSIPEVLNRL